VDLLDPTAPDPCIKVMIRDDRIKGGLHRVMLRRTPGDHDLPTVDGCAVLVRAPVVNSAAPPNDIDQRFFLSSVEQVILDEDFSDDPEMVKAPSIRR
jgi:hypothetical protein